MLDTVLTWGRSPRIHLLSGRSQTSCLPGGGPKSERPRPLLAAGGLRTPCLAVGDASSARVTGSLGSAQWCGRLLPGCRHSSPRAWHQRDEERRSAASVRANGARSRRGSPAAQRGDGFVRSGRAIATVGRLRNYGRGLGAAEAADVSSVTTDRAAWIGSVAPCRCQACRAIVVRTRCVRCGRRIANWPRKTSSIDPSDKPFHRSFSWPRVHAVKACAILTTT